MILSFSLALLGVGIHMKLMKENTTDGVKEKHVLVIEATFQTNAKKITTREYCNLYGLWKEEMEG